MKYYNYGGISEKGIQFDSVIIDDVEYIVPATVAKALKNYADRLAKECSDHEATKKKYEEIDSKKYDVVAERIMSALEQGVSENGAVRESLLKHSINEQTGYYPGTSEPAYGYRHELRRRIVLALEGKTPEGKPYR